MMAAAADRCSSIASPSRSTGTRIGIARGGIIERADRDEFEELLGIGLCPPHLAKQLRQTCRYHRDGKLFLACPMQGTDKRGYPRLTFDLNLLLYIVLNRRNTARQRSAAPSIYVGNPRQQVMGLLEMRRVDHLAVER